MGRGGGLVRALAAAWLVAGAADARAACTDDQLEITPETVQRVEAALHCVVNERRAAYGLSGLTPNRRLDLAARRHAEDMVRRGYFAHDAPPPAPDGKTFWQRVRSTGYDIEAGGETIYTGSQTTAREAVTVLLASPGHCEIVLNPSSYADLGAGAADGQPDGGTGGTVVLIFAHEYGTPPAPEGHLAEGTCPVDPDAPPPPAPPPPDDSEPPPDGTAQPSTTTPPGSLGTLPPAPRPVLVDAHALPRPGGRLVIRGWLRPRVAGSRLQIRVRRGSHLRTARRRTTRGGRFAALVRPPSGPGRLRVTVYVARRAGVHAARTLPVPIGFDRRR